MVKQGSIIKINFDPIIGSEQGGYRPAVVVSNDFMISKTNIISICPITTKHTRKTALNVLLDNSTITQGAVLCAHQRSVDINKRTYTVVEKMTEEKIMEVLNTLISMIERPVI